MYKSLTILLGIFRMLAFPVQFQDRGFTYGQPQIDSLMRETELYLNEQFCGTREFTIDLMDPVLLGGNAAYYGKNSSDRKDSQIRDAIGEALSSIKDKTDLSQYDNDGDGEIDNVLIVAAGPSEADGAGEDWIWPQYGQLKDIGGVIYVSGKRVNTFTTITEMMEEGIFSGIGTAVHELGHVLGLKDMYDTDGELSGGLTKGLWGSLSVMDHGLENNGGATPPPFNAIELDQLGIGRCDTLGVGSFRLAPVSESHSYIKAFSSERGRYQLMECRSGNGRDTYSGARGLIVYNVDRSDSPAGYSDYYKIELSAAERWIWNEVNCNPDHQCAELSPAITEATDISQISFPQVGKNRFPVRNLAVVDIAMDGDDVTFSVIEPVKDVRTVTYQDAATVSWICDPSIHAIDSQISFKDSSDSTRTAKAAEDKGRFYATLSGLKPKTACSALISITDSDGLKYSHEVRFRTKSRRNGTLPFIYLNAAERNADGSFKRGTGIPLMVYNATGVAEIRWTFNGGAIKTGPDGLYHIEREGQLKAEVFYEDGSVELIIKEIRL